MKPLPPSVVSFCTPLASDAQRSEPPDSGTLLKPKSVLVRSLLKICQWFCLPPPTSLLSPPTQLPLTACSCHIHLLVGSQAHQAHCPLCPGGFLYPECSFPGHPHGSLPHHLQMTQMSPFYPDPSHPPFPVLIFSGSPITFSDAT